MSVRKHALQRGRPGAWDVAWFLLLTACGGGSVSETGVDTGGSTDATVDVPDVPRVRDTGALPDIDSAFGQCAANVTPQTGSVATTFTITGTNLLSTNMATLSIAPAGGAPVYTANVAVSAGTFTHMVTGSQLGVGTFRISVNDPSFTCSVTVGPLTVQ